MEDLRFQPGDHGFTAKDSPSGSYSAFFEDDGETGYFYALDLEKPDDIGDRILDAVHIYNVRDVIDKDKPSGLTIAWSMDGLKCALLINGYAHAAFDFTKRRGYCRTDFPNFPQVSDKWISTDHSWSDDAVAWLKQITQ